MSGIYDSLRRVFSYINLMCAAIAAALLLFIAAIISFEVFSRAITGSSRLWVIEVSEYSLLFITFLGAPYLLEKNMHVVLDLVYNSLRRRPKQLIRILNAAIGLFICATLAVVGLQVVTEQFAIGVREVTVMRPLSWWITAALPLGMFLMTVQFFDQIVRVLRGEDN